MEILTPVGRMVQGSFTLETKMDPRTNTPKLGKDGQPFKECFIALAIRKDDPGWPTFYAAVYNTARQEFPSLFDATGRCTHPQFAFKIQDGDGVDQNGASVAGKPGFAGHWIVKMATQFLPRCFHEGRFDPAQQIADPNSVIKRGYFIRCNVSIRGNGVKPGGQEKPGVFISPNLVSLVAFGEEIQSGPDASQAFGAAPISGLALPPGASATPIVAGGAALPPPGAPTLAPPPLPGATLAPPPPAAVLPPPAAVLAPPPPVAAGPVFQMQPSAMGATREALLAAGWTDEQLIAAGHMVRVG